MALSNTALEQNPFAFLGEEEDTDILIQNAKASAAAAAVIAKEASLEEGERKKKNERKNESFSTKAKRIILPRNVTKRDIIVRKEKPEGKGDAKGGNNGNVQQNSVAEAHRCNGDNKGTINKHKSYNGHDNNDFKGNNNNGVEGHRSRNKNNVNSYDRQSPASNKGHPHGGYHGKDRSFDGFANNGGRGQNQGFHETSCNASDRHLEKKVEKVSNGVEKNVEDDGWTKIEKRRSKVRRNGSYDYSNERSSQVSTVSEKDTTCEDVQEVNNSTEKEVGEVQEDVNVENSNAALEAVNDGNKINETERKQNNAAGEKQRIKKNGSQKRKNKNKNKNIEAAENDSQKKETPVTKVMLMTLEEYEKSLLEKRKALESLKKTENSRAIQLKDFESMVHIEKKTNTKNSQNLNLKKDLGKEEEKSHKVVSMREFEKKWRLTLNLPLRRPYSDWKEPAKGNGVASETEKQQNGKDTGADKRCGSEKRGNKKNDAHPILVNLEQFPILGGKAA